MTVIDGMDYEFFEHTADAKFRAYGRSLEEAFANAARATASLMYDWAAVKGSHSHSIEVRGRDLDQLLVAFLEEILFLFETRSFLLHAVEDPVLRKVDGGFVLNVLFRGDRIGEEDDIYGEVKAITYNEMEIHSRDPIFVQVVVDL